MRNHTKFHWCHQPSVWTCTVKCNHYTSLVPRAGKQIWILFEFFANKKRAGDEILFPQTMMARERYGYVWCNAMGILSRQSRIFSTTCWLGELQFYWYCRVPMLINCMGFSDLVKFTGLPSIACFLVRKSTWHHLYLLRIFKSCSLFTAIIQW